MHHLSFCVDASFAFTGVQADRSNTPLFYRRLASYTVVEEKHIDLPPEPKPEPPAEMKKDDEPMAEDGEETKEDGPAEEAAAEEEAAPATEEEAVAEEAAAEEAPAAEPYTEMTDAAAENGEAEA